MSTEQDDSTYVSPKRSNLYAQLFISLSGKERTRRCALAVANDNYFRGWEEGFSGEVNIVRCTYTS